MLNVLTVPAFQDNYLWLIHDGTHAAAVDPGDAEPILAALDAHGLSLAAILLTHHHADHVGGVPALLARHSVPVFGPRNDGIDVVSRTLTGGDQVVLDRPALRLEVIDVPGHTRGHIAYHAPEQGWLFCGDTLFAGGCGRLFEGTPEQMAASLMKLAGLPEQTQVFCAHEYTLSNLRFAAAVEPGNEALQERIRAEQAKRDAGQPTVPTTVGLEKATNPFLRYAEPAIADQMIAAGHVSSREPIAVFAALRAWKNVFR
ncbi:MAG TPA: hydroxyacylglutathione hydrolase [Noviherbaspirillum sp.]|jgi:hydroxyacylglutathione hydrolase|uniref:hydroxyacylglutathione hydrolase n=1 Tax=Noviherbaspirillum sp. TaxID=1926288 RepID=UPI002F9229FD